MKRIELKAQTLMCFIVCLSFSSLHSQVYDNHFGTGNDVGVTISSSPEQGMDEAIHTLNGTGYLPDLKGASRFLGQASMGASYEEIEYVTQVGIDAWLDEQFAMPPSPYLTKYDALYTEIENLIQAVHPGADVKKDRFYTGYAFYEKILKDDDVLRNKAAFALSQILVLSTQSISLNGHGRGGSSYYDVLYEGAFGNFKDILTDVSLHLAMGYYLSHFKNKKADPSIGTLPDENYAREIMQLFTIGLYELNNDGTYKLDGNGNRIPTYDIDDVQELAKVFTGLSGGAWDLDFDPSNAGQPLEFGRSLNNYDLTVPMAMWEEHHDQGPKTMVDGTVIPAGQSGMQDINDAIDVLFNHPNVGPFIANRLIQQLVKSNPTPAYINRVASVFNNNGAGIRGDMQAVFRAILTDPEARDCAWIDDPKTGKLKQPLERLSNLFRAFDIDSPSGKLWFFDKGLRDVFEQAFMAAPSVFNFFSPFYAEESVVAPNDMVSPEFQILHAVTAIHYLNEMEDAIKVRPFRNKTAVNPNSPVLDFNDPDVPFLDFSDEITVLDTNGVGALLDRLDIILCHGQLSANVKTIIEGALIQLINTGNFTSEDIVHNALYFIMASPDYVILE